VVVPIHFIPIATGFVLVQPPPIESQDDAAAADDLVKACARIREQVGRVVVGQDEVIEQLLIAILSRGHCLLEGVQGSPRH
jgi:MoxR-like ATPase